MNPFFETEGVYKINGLIFDVKNTCFDYCVCEFSCISSERINFQELCQHFGLPRFTSTLSTEPQRRSFFRFNYFITFLFPKISPIREWSLVQASPLKNIRQGIEQTTLVFFFPFAVSASCIISSTNAKKTINDFSLFTNRFFLIPSVTNVSKMTFPILEVTLLLHKLAQH